ncbi:hypothetical protein DAEQUDRAFT_731472 [Daedalea quercina L-15889]|uniref:Uncharacterized protein n=1 Tax=Daedalea quercina L-15889 TaxID=1314783 RepID=A0A165MA25_9APHY|nr:hypothetical protein DAEQUDRAFT_731472 [Daedalea quercina L-15889]
MSSTVTPRCSSPTRRPPRRSATHTLPLTARRIRLCARSPSQPRTTAIKQRLCRPCPRQRNIVSAPRPTGASAVYVHLPRPVLASSVSFSFPGSRGTDPDPDPDPDLVTPSASDGAAHPCVCPSRSGLERGFASSRVLPAAFCLLPSAQRN